jgi:thiol-disulfide isomerase/thioredoxin
VLAVLCLAACQASPQVPAPSPAGVEIVEAPAGTTDVAALVRTTAAKVAAQHRKLVVYVGATWCEPCQQFHAAAARHALDDELPGLTLLEFDFDRDELALDKAGYQSPLIPLFVVPAADGRAGPRRAFGGKHGIDNVPLLTGKVRALLSSQ